MAKMTEKNVKNALMEQLRAKGADLAHFEDLVNDYCEFWKIEKALQKDIEKRGVSYPECTASGIEVMKNNPSVKDVQGINKQMLSILKELGLTTEGLKAVDDDVL